MAAPSKVNSKLQPTVFHLFIKFICYLNMIFVLPFLFPEYAAKQAFQRQNPPKNFAKAYLTKTVRHCIHF
jgi:hypothetical protein